MLQKKLFTDDRIIESYGFDQTKILDDIITLHIPEGKIQADATYGYGVFYNHLPRPEFCFDLTPKRKNVTQADCRDLPLADNQLDSIIFDPPFIITDHKDSDHYIMHKRYSGFKVVSELRQMYSASIREFFRVLRPGGRLVVKCQDTTHGKKNYCIHNEVLNMAAQSGFIFLDLFILLAKDRFTGGVHKQRTARKHHCYFLVFKKKSRIEKVEVKPPPYIEFL